MASLTWDGLDELGNNLFALPDELGQASSALVDRSATEAALAIKAAYPRRSGILINSVKITERTSLKYGLRAKVVNTAPYAYAFESGRRLGTHGTTPARPTFIPIRNKYQRALYDAIKTLMIAHGLTVSGDANE